MSKPSLRKHLNGAHLLVTGTTGFLGKVWLAQVLEFAPEVARVTLLIRPSRGLDAHQRAELIFDTSPVFRRLRAKHGADFGGFLEGRVAVVEGDLTKPLAGLTPDEADDLASTVDAVVHFAGVTDFEPDPRLAVPTNIDGALHVADIAARTPSRKMVQISTCFVAGNVTAPTPETLDTHRTPTGALFDPAAERDVLHEMCADKSKVGRTKRAGDRSRDLGWPNLYTFSKALAEKLLGQREDIDVVMARPAIVECADSFPFAGWNEGINTAGPIIWLLSTAFRSLPAQRDNTLDVIPVDLCARGVTLVLAHHLAGTAPEVVQLAAGPHTMRFDRAVELSSLGARKYRGRPGAKAYERYFLRYMDATIGVRAVEGPLAVKRIRQALGELRGGLKSVDTREALGRWHRLIGTRVEKGARRTADKLGDASRLLGTVQRILELYKPFIQDNCFEWHTDWIEAQDAGLAPEDRELMGCDMSAIDWHDYWINVQVPGLFRWSIPQLMGEKVEYDPPSNPPLRFSSAPPAMALDRTA